MRTRFKTVGAVAASLCALAACHDSSGTSSPGDGAVDRTADGAVDASAAGMCGADVPAGQACNALVLTGAGVMPTCTTGTIATGQGGTIVDGTYVLTATTYYDDPTCPKFPVMETIEIADGCLQIAVGPSPLAATASATFTVAGVNRTTTPTCLHAESDAATFMRTPSTTTFTATATTLTIFTQRTAPGNTGADFAVFTKQ
jgi:hypothetical protein